MHEVTEAVSCSIKRYEKLVLSIESFMQIRVTGGFLAILYTFSGLHDNRTNDENRVKIVNCFFVCTFFMEHC